MRLLRSRIFWAILVAWLGGVHHARAAAVGAQFLSSIEHPRAVAMGRAGIGLADGPSLVGRNPAAVASAVRGSAGACYVVPMASAQGGCLLAVLPAGRSGALATHLYYDNLGTFPIVEAEGRAAGSGGETRGVAWARYGLDLAPEVGLGVAAKAFRHQIVETIAVGSALDVGGVWRSPVPGLQVGLVLRDVGPAFRAGAHRNRLPTEVGTGLGYALRREEFPALRGDLAAALDASRPLAGGFALRSGLEYRFRAHVPPSRPVSDASPGSGSGGGAKAVGVLRRFSPALRAGGELLEEELRFAGGAGATIGGWSVDYGFGMGDEGTQEHWFGVGRSFGKARRKTAPEILLARRREVKAREREDLVRRVAEETSQRFVDAAVERADVQIRSAREAGAEADEPERLHRAEERLDQARLRATEGAYDEAWILASEAAMEADELKEDLARRRLARESEKVAPPPPVARPEARAQRPRPTAIPPRASKEPRAAPETAPASPAALTAEQENALREGERLHAGGRHEEAVRSLEALSRATQGHSRVGAALGRACLHLGMDAYRARDYERAAEWWRKGLSHAPDSVELKSFLANVESKLEALRALGSTGP